MRRTFRVAQFELGLCCLLTLFGCASGGQASRAPADGELSAEMVTGKEATPGESELGDEEGAYYRIDGKAVSEKAFTEKVDSMTYVVGSWYCEESEDGGETGYELVDSDGVRWSYIEDGLENLDRIE